MGAEAFLKYPFVLCVGFLVTFLVTPLVRWAAPRVGLVDVPDSRRIHAAPTPSGGGVAVFIGAHVAFAAVFLLPWTPFNQLVSVDWWRRFFLVSFALLVVGLADDRRAMRPLVKLAWQIVVALVAYGLHFRVGNILGVRLPPGADVAGTVAWFLVFINAFNLIDGLDGLATGLAIVSALGIAGALLLRQFPGDVLVLLGFIGACAAFLRYNFHPATIFLGDSGSMFLGLMLAVVSVSTGSKGTAAAAIGIPLLAVGVPVFDAVLAVWRRSARRFLQQDKDSEGTADGIMRPDLEHLHHRLIAMGLSHRRVAVALYGFSALLAGIGLLSLILRARALGLFLVAFVIGSYVIFKHVAWIELWDSGSAILHGLRRPSRRLGGVIGYPVVDVCLMALALAFALLLAGLPQAVDLPAKLAWLQLVPIWVGVPFLTVVFTRAYSRVWSLARVSEFILLGAGVAGGALLSAGIALLFTDWEPREVLLLAVLYGGLAAPAVVGSRTVYRVVQDLMAGASRWQDDRAGAKRVLVCGAGYGCTLFLRESSFHFLAGPGGRRVVGLIDEDPGLRKLVVHGYRVCGTPSELPGLIDGLRADEIVVVAPLTPESRRHVQEAAAGAGVDVMQWRTELTPYDSSDSG